MKNKILIVSYSFGDAINVGGKRCMKIANFLSENGFLIYTLSSKSNTDFANLDFRIKSETFNSKYPKVLNKNTLHFFEKIFYKIIKTYRYLTLKGSIYDKTKTSEIEIIKIVSNLIIKNGIKNIIVSGAPFSLLYFISKNFKDQVNIISDFRDPWTWGIGYGMSTMSKKRLEYEKKCEDLVLKNSNHIFCASYDLEIKLNSKLKTYNKSSVVLINSFIDKQKKSVNYLENNKSNKISIAHIGTIALETEKYWQTFLNLLEKSQFKIELKIYGNNNIFFHNEALKRSNLTIIFIDRLSEKMLMKNLTSSDIAVLFKMDVFSNTYPTKFFNYINTELPIISFTKKGVFSDEIENNNIGIIFNDKTKVDEFDEFIDSFKLINYNNYDFSKFEISGQLKKIIEVLE